MDQLSIKVLLASSQRTHMSRILALALDSNAIVRGLVALNPRLPKGVAERLSQDEVESVAELARIGIAIRDNSSSLSELEGQIRDETFYSLWGDEHAEEEEEERSKEDKKPSPPVSDYEW